MHQLVLGQIDGAHATAADELQNAIFAEEESAVLLLHQPLDLPGREQLLLDQLVRDYVGIRRKLAAIGRFQLLEAGLERGRIDERAALDEIQKSLGGECRHAAMECSPSARSPRGNDP